MTDLWVACDELKFQLRDSARFVVVLDPQDGQAYSVGMPHVLPCEGTKKLLLMLANNRMRARKKPAQAWLCPQFHLNGPSCPQGSGCGGVHITPIGYKTRRPWCRTVNPVRTANPEFGSQLRALGFLSAPEPLPSKPTQHMDDEDEDAEVPLGLSQTQNEGAFPIPTPQAPLYPEPISPHHHPQQRPHHFCPVCAQQSTNEAAQLAFFSQGPCCLYTPAPPYAPPHQAHANHPGTMRASYPPTNTATSPYAPEFPLAGFQSSYTPEPWSEGSEFKAYHPQPYRQAPTPKYEPPSWGMSSAGHPIPTAPQHWPAPVYYDPSMLAPKPDSVDGSLGSTKTSSLASAPSDSTASRSQTKKKKRSQPKQQRQAPEALSSSVKETASFDSAEGRCGRCSSTSLESGRRQRTHSAPPACHVHHP